ncbi:uncharacterized protein [Montipora capricornis]|uniref:uncharacterized protein n=1 Tax=Montipora capricornis TaxID=246305 RepID=UPI0035F19010
MDKSEDTISFAKQEIETVNKGLTKRNCLAFVAQLWDPMGFVSSVSIQMRIALQERWSMVLSWITNSPRKFKPFVSARVAEIQETVDVDKFRYIPSNLNPADASTRENEEIPSNEHQNLECGNDHDILKEMKGMTPKNSLRKEEQHPKSCCVAAALDFKPRNPTLESLLTTCSSFIKVRKVLAYVLRFVHNLRQKSKETGAISVEELRRSETFLYKWAQESLNREDVGKSLTARKDDQGILRAHGQLEKIRTMPAKMRNPIILPHNHKIVLLLLKHLHKERAHCGYKSLTYESRKNFWIIGVQSIAKQLTRNCIVCRKLRQRPLQQLMGQLPNTRAEIEKPAFACTAIDMFGPIQIRLSHKTLKEAQIIIFACMTSRAIHLELVTD